MIKIEIQAEDYRVADAMTELVSKIETYDLLDALYDDEMKSLTIRNDNYTAIISKLKESDTPKMNTHKNDMIEECKQYAGMEYEINDLWNGYSYDTEIGLVTENGIERFANNKILHQFETYDEIDDEVLENILLAVKENPLVVEMAHTYLEDDETEEGGISFAGETLLDFMLELNMPLTSTKDEINTALIECGIMPVFKS